MGNTNTTNTSTQSVVTSLVSNSVIFGVFLALFILFRLKIHRIYEPKSSYNLINDEKKPEPLPSGLWQWFLPLLKKSDNFVIRQAGLDGFFFLRYLSTIATICFFYMLVFFPILLPVNAIDGKGDTGLDKFTISNVEHRSRYYAHAILAWVFYLGVVYIIYRELTFYTSTRQAVLSSPRYGKKLSSRVVLFQTVPDQYLDEAEFAKLFEDVKKVWIARGASNIADKVKEREKLVQKLENAQNQLLRKAMKLKLKKEKKGEVISPADDISAYVPDNKRPTHKLKFLIGKKVDTINYAKEKIQKLNAEIEELQNNHDSASPMNSVFVEFGSQYSAQVAFQSVTHHVALNMSPRYIGLNSKDIVWMNLRMFWWERLARKFGALAAIIALLIFWSVPVAFVGVISNITYLTNKLPWLKFIYNLPKQLLGLITSMFPTIALAVLMMLLPIFIRMMAKISGAPSTQHIEYYTQQAYFGFQVIQVFLVTTISSSAASTVTQIIQEPSSSMLLLSRNLPKASNFYVSYIVLQGLTVSSGALLQISTLILYYILSYLLDSTPRKKFDRFHKLPSMSWGTTFPVFTNLAVITLTYCIISPFMLLFASAGFFVLYVAYLYNLTYCFRESADGRGMYYPRALFQTMVGVYLGEVCLLGLFAVSKAWGPIVITAILIVVTVFIHINLNTAFDELMTVLPVDAMKPLDGVSETPSYKRPTGARYSGLYDTTASRFEKSFDGESSLRPPTNVFELDDLNRLSIDRTRHGSSVPLLAEGDTSVIPPAPYWKRFLQPHIYSSYKVAKTKIPDIYNFQDPDEETDPIKIEHAYDFPAVSARCPKVWLPRDPMGLSAKMCEEFRDVLEVSDENAFFDDKGKIVWTGPPPSYEDTVEDDKRGMLDSPFEIDEVEQQEQQLQQKEDEDEEEEKEVYNTKL